MGKFGKLALLFLVGTALFGGVYLVTSWGSASLVTRAGEGKSAILFMMPSQIQSLAGEEFSVDLKIDTAGQAVGGIEVAVEYNPIFLQLAGKVIPGTAFDTFESESQSGQVTLRGVGGIMGQATVATLTFRGQRLSQGEVGIRADSIVWDETRGKNILKNASGVQVSISE
ncbi:hypothetical protein ACFLZP_00925 [Patescibacteria group bacterium]